MLKAGNYNCVRSVNDLLHFFTTEGEPCVGFEVTAMDVKSFYLQGYDMCIPLKINQYFGSIGLHLQGSQGIR
jgi:hypothetical protein